MASKAVIKPQKTSKKQKLYYNRNNQKTINKPKFYLAGQVKSEWIQISEFSIAQFDTKFLEHKIESLDNEVGECGQYTRIYDKKIGRKNALKLVKPPLKQLCGHRDILADDFLD
jgi:hypothetical protein